MKNKEKQLEKRGVSSFGMRKALRSYKTRIGLIIALVFVVLALLTPLIAPHDPLLVDVTIKLQGPSAEYPLGTDQLGRCILSRLLWGSRYSLRYSFTILIITLCIGVPLGLISGYAGGRTDSVIMRIIDVFMAMPSFVVTLAIAGTLGASGRNLVIAMSLVFWSEYARLSRALTLQVKGQSFMMALKAGGLGNLRIIFHHVLRNIAPSIISLATMEIGSLILHIASFSFMGLGVQAPTPEWGIMLADSKSYIQTYPRLMIYPGILIMIVVLAFNFLGEGIQDGMGRE